MKISCLTARRKLSILRVTALVFLLQMVSPAVQVVMANYVDGYTGPVCAMMSGEKSRPVYFQCSACIIQANLNGLPVAVALTVDARFILDSIGQIEPVYPTLSTRLYPRFQSRAPPL